MTAAASSRRPRLASPATAVVLAVLVLAVGGACAPLASLAHQRVGAGGTIVLLAGFEVVGFLLAWKRPGNPLGWLLLGAAGFLAVSDAASFYAVADYRVHQGVLPLGWLAMVAQPGWAPAIVSFGLAVLLFPDGQLPSPRWRWALWGYLGIAAAWMGGALWLTVAALARHGVQVDSGGNLLALSRPSGSAAWWGVVQDLFFPALGTVWLASLAAQAMRWRRSSGERREQLKWLLAGSAIALTGGFLTLAFSSSASSLGRTAATAGGLMLIALPGGMAVAILKYRLYEIDRIISRTLAYAAVTGLLVGVYAGLVLLATHVLSFKTPVAVAASTLAAAALFASVRRLVQRIVDRRFNRARYDAERTVAAFTARLQDAVDLDTVRADLLTAVDQALEPAHASVWLAGGQR